MNILITGASGLIGRELSRTLAEHGHNIFALRRKSWQIPPYWDIERGIIELGSCGPPDAVINLAGENIAAGRWTAERKQRMLRSRIASTRLLTEFFAQAEQKPKVLISASAVGIYGDRGDEELTERSHSGAGFLAELGQAWEAATEPAAAAGIRVVNARFGIVLSPQGGALATMLPPFRMGLGGCLGSGRQWLSWISLRELPMIIAHLLQHEELSGPVNLTAPQPVSNRDFTETLAHVLRRPAFLPAPVFLLKLLFGEMAEDLLLASAKVRPGRLLDSGYVFKFPELDAALRHLLLPA
ncbi:TIGR01777 family oxidoreductase [Candidatus Electronema sp. JM]|uniref:TIGR01777 family oxidoreductase n=1 Tax=Candidatus Electronema sp. JM TaxID=3401571 RepID=UPI003AA8E1B6